jgi:DNA segregation ATPase FtsK/SpoIIIE-like protein
LVWEIREPAWTDSVVLSGVADAVIRLPDGRWCVLEFKTSLLAPEAGLAQACLYYAMLAATEQKPGALSLVRFGAEVEERLYRDEELERALPSLKALVGRLAGVTGASGEAPAARSEITSEHRRLAEKLLEALYEFRCPAELAGDPVAGPTFIRFYVSPARGVKPKAVMTNADAICVRLGLKEPPFIQIVEGRLAIDIQRPDRQVLAFSSIRHLLPQRRPGQAFSKLVVGMDLAGKTEFANLASTAHAHILVVGTTGSGKSEWLRTALATLLLTNTPDTLRLVLLDPKRNAFNELATSAFLQRPLVFPDETDAAAVFEDLVDEMETRYRRLQEQGCDSLAELAERGTLLPRIVCMCDEYFDLIQRGRSERRAIEQSLFRLGAKARAAGIHLILATQQANREVIRGPLDANMPARVVFKTAKALESRLVLGENGAEHLLGEGDLLFRDVGSPRRLQAPYLAAEERTAIFHSAGSWRG